MLKITSIRINHQPLKDTLRSHIVSAENLTFSWSVQSSHDSNRQTSFRITIEQDEAPLWDSGTIQSAEQMFAYAGPTLPQGVMLHVHIAVSDQYEEISGHCEDYFVLSDIEWKAPWIGAPDARPRTQALYFRKTFTVSKELAGARLYACGIGYQHVLLNGKILDETAPFEYLLDPVFTDYSKQAQYVMYPFLENELDADNCIGIIVGEGWRDNHIITRMDASNAQPIPFRGDPMLTAMLVLDYTDGTSETISTDDSWTCGSGPITDNNLYLGTTYDARLEDPAWATPSGHSDAPNAVIKFACGDYGKLVPMQLPPIDDKEERAPISQWSIGGKCYLDFGQNMAGVLRIRIPGGLPAGHEITLSHAEELMEDGTLYTAALRGAAATDTYIASGNEDDDVFFQPPFTFHGFRYACISGLGDVITPDDVTAVALRNDLDKASFFTCGNPLLTQIYTCCIQTERSNTHGMLTDCPQRDERLGWLNDATVRFEAFPYAFEADAMFRKIVQDILNDQHADGAIADTTPFIWGHYPADPVCASFLIAALQAYRHYGDKDIIAHGFDGFRAWTDLLLAKCDHGISTYSYWGDWAGPAYACEVGHGARSAVTPGIFMSTGYTFFTCRTLSQFATILGRDDLAQDYAHKADAVKRAMLAKWYNPQTKLFATGSMACIVFPLWLGIYPDGDDRTAAAKLKDDLVSAGYRFTTGNLCTRYLFEILTRYGYADEAYTLISKDTYPSFGAMLQQEATTIWERFELKKDGGMNSHNHPMYAAIYYWFFSGLAGIEVTAPACNAITIAPAFPKGLNSVHCGFDTVKGMVDIRWFKRYDKLTLMVSIPFGMTANVVFAGETKTCTSGFHVFSTPCETESHLEE